MSFLPAEGINEMKFLEWWKENRAELVASGLRQASAEIAFNAGMQAWMPKPENFKDIDETMNRQQEVVAAMTLEQWIERELETFYAMDFLADYEKMKQVKERICQ